MNPDIAAQKHLEGLLQDFEITYPDGDVGVIRQVDRGFISTPTSFPYVSIHSTDSRAPVKRLGNGSGMAARDIEIDLLICIEYEDADPRRGNDRLTQIRWEVFRLLAQNVRTFPGIELAQFDEAHIYAITGDDGGFQDWGYIGQVLIPCTVILRGDNQ